MAPSRTDTRESLKYKLSGKKGGLDTWGFEYVKNLAGEIGQEWAARKKVEKDTAGVGLFGGWVVEAGESLPLAEEAFLGLPGPHLKYATTAKRQKTATPPPMPPARAATGTSPACVPLARPCSRRAHITCRPHDWQASPRAQEWTRKYAM